LPAAIAEAKAFFIFTPIVCIYLLKDDLLQNPLRAFGWAAAVGVFLTGSIAVYNSIYTYREKDRFRVYESRTRETLQELIFNPQKMLANELNVTNIRRRLNSDHKEMVIGRLAMVIFAHDMVSTDWLTTIFGKGIGSFTENSFTDKDERGLVELRAKNVIESAILELGYGGLMLVTMLLMAVYLNNRDNKDHYDDPFWRGIAYGFQGIILLMALSSQYVGSFLHGSHTTFVFWFLLALLTSAGTRAIQEEQRIVRTPPFLFLATTPTPISCGLGRLVSTTR
jgi:hypothetical protein